MSKAQWTNAAEIFPFIRRLGQFRGICAATAATDIAWERTVGAGRRRGPAWSGRRESRC
jgi:hypothetical protein